MSSYSDYADAVARIEQSKGAGLAQAAANKGQIWGNTIASLGDAIPKQVQEAMRAGAEKRKTAQIQGILQQAGGDLGKAAPQIMAIDPKIGTTLMDAHTKAQESAEKLRTLQTKAARDWEDEQLNAVHDEDSYASYQITRKAAGLPSDGPPQFTPEWLKQKRLSRLSPEKQFEVNYPAEAKPQGLMNVAPGGAIFDPASREQVFENPYQMTPDQTADNARADAAAKAAGDERATDNARADAQLGLSRGQLLLAQQREKREAASGGSTPANDTALVSAVMANPDLFYNLTPTVRTRIGPALAEKGFKQFGPAPSAMERMDSRKFEKAGPVLAAMTELSEKINTQQGVIAKISGGIERAKATANLNDDVAEYQALISGFTPLVARALGHTGVLTQQDVDSVKALFPSPGDSKSLRDRKVSRLLNIVGQLEGQQGTGAPNGPAPAAKPSGGGAPSYQDYLKSRGQK